MVSEGFDALQTIRQLLERERDKLLEDHKDLNDYYRWGWWVDGKSPVDMAMWESSSNSPAVMDRRIRSRLLKINQALEWVYVQEHDNAIW